jgi:hypothetical protein
VHESDGAIVGSVQQRDERLICDVCQLPLGVYERFHCVQRDGKVCETSMLALGDEGVNLSEITGAHLDCPLPFDGCNG